MTCNKHNDSKALNNAFISLACPCATTKWIPVACGCVVTVSLTATARRADVEGAVGGCCCSEGAVGGCCCCERAVGCCCCCEAVTENNGNCHFNNILSVRFTQKDITSMVKCFRTNYTLYCKKYYPTQYTIAYYNNTVPVDAPVREYNTYRPAPARSSAV